MFCKYTLCLAIVLAAFTMSPASAQAQLFPPQPAHAAPAAANCCWNERTFVIALRARWFANSMERQGYIVQLHRIGLFNWSVRYRMA